MFSAFEMAMNYLKDEQIALTTTSQSMKLDSERIDMDNGEIVVPQLTSGVITLRNAKLSSSVVGRIVQSTKFDFIDSSEVEGSFSWISTAIDRDKKSVFGVNSSTDSINLVPRFNATFEAFLDFYRQILEEVDPTATFQTFGATVGK